MEISEQQKARIVELAQKCERQHDEKDYFSRIAGKAFARLAEKNGNRYSAEAFRIAQSKE